jgi:tetratricopeptide (TPR) repeat protein
VLLDPNYAEARHLTAILALRDGRYEEAAAHLKVVTELTPQNLSAWQSLAMAQSQLGHRPEAIAAAAHARSLASNQEEIDMTEATIRLVNSPAQQQGATAPLHRDGAVPSTWQNRTGDHSVTGTLVQLDCLGSVARLHVSSRDGVVKLLVTDPSKVVLINAPAASVSLECGKLTPRAATVEYLEKPDPQHQTSGEVTAIGFR